MAGGTWYMEAPDGRRFNWSKAPSFECPMALVRYDVIDIGTGEVKATVERRPEEAVGVTFRRHVSPELAAAAETLAVFPLKLAGALARLHRSPGGGERERVDGKPTDRCAGCGHKMRRLGFHCWVDEPYPEGEEDVSKRVAQRLGFGPPRKTTRSFYVDTKREAEAWARDELAAARAVAAEETS